MSQEQLQGLITMLRSQPILGKSIEETRAGFEQLGNAFPVPADVRCEPVQANGVPAEWVTAPGASKDRAILYLHGGGYGIGSINTHRALAAGLSAASGASALVLDYRLAPECPFPAAVEDATAAYEWLLAKGLKPGKVVIAGDSAGGGLTVATLVNLRDKKRPLPAAGICFSPWVDLEGLGESMTSRASRDPLVQKMHVVELAKAYLGKADCRTPLAAPLYADLSGLPPLLIQVGEAETLYDDSVRLAERAKKAGVKVTLDPWEDMIHVFQLFAPMLDEGKQAIEKVGEFVREQTE